MNNSHETRTNATSNILPFVSILFFSSCGEWSSFSSLAGHIAAAFFFLDKDNHFNILVHEKIPFQTRKKHSVDRPHGNDVITDVCAGLTKCDQVHLEALELFHALPVPPPLLMLDLAGEEVPREGSDFTLLRERLCISLSINTCGLDWTYLESLAVNEREREVTRLYRPIIICQQGSCSHQPERG